MRDPNISFLLQIKPTQATRQIEFNQQSTNNLLSQLKISLQDVETIINKSKEALGLASSLEIQLCQVEQVRGSKVSKDSGGERMDRLERKGGRQGEEDYGQSIYFNVSGDLSKESTIRDQLTYSVSLGTFSRVKLEDTETINIRASRNILRKLDFGQTQSRIQTTALKQQQISPPKPQLQPQHTSPDTNSIQPAAISSPQPQQPQTTSRLYHTPTTNKIKQQQQQQQMQMQIEQKTTNKKQNLSSLHSDKQQFSNNTQGYKQNQSQQPFQLEIMDADHTHGILAFSKMEDMASKFQPYTRDWQFKGDAGETMQFQSVNKPYQGKESNFKFQSPKPKQKQEQKQIASLKQKRKQAYSTQQSAQSTIQSGKWNKYLKQKKAQLTSKSKHTNRYLSSIQEQPDITLKKPEKSPQTIAPRAQRIKIFKQRVMNFNKSTLPVTASSTNQAKTSINVNTHTHHDHSRQNAHERVYQYRGRVSIEDGEMDNTCARNQLENILMLNYASRKTKNNQRFESSLASGDLFATTQEKQDQKKNFQSLPIKVPQKKIFEIQRKSKSKSVSRQKSKSPSRSPSRSPAQRKQPQRCTTQHSPIKKPQYIQKYIQNMQKSPISPNQKHPPHPHLQTDYNQSPAQLKYSHVKKSPQNKKPTVFQIQEHLSSQKQKVCTREEFIDKMLQQCYVRRFLSKNQLWRIYDEFCARKVPRYLWEQKVIEKIFKKIHEIDEIM